MAILPGHVATARRCHPVACATLLIALVLPSAARAMCDVIPGVTKEFRGALGSLNRPYAIPGDNGEILTLTLQRDPLDPNACDGASPGFPATAAEAVVTVVFTPPAGPANAVVLAADCEGLASELARLQCAGTV